MFYWHFRIYQYLRARKMKAVTFKPGLLAEQFWGVSPKAIHNFIIWSELSECSKSNVLLLITYALEIMVADIVERFVLNALHRGCNVKAASLIIQVVFRRQLHVRSLRETYHIFALLQFNICHYFLKNSNRANCRWKIYKLWSSVNKKMRWCVNNDGLF